MSVVADIYCFGLSACFLVAFASLYVQWPGLYGAHGVLPVTNFLENGYRPLVGQPLKVQLRNLPTVGIL